MGAGRLEPHTTVEPNQQLTGEQLLQIGPDLAVRGQQPAREGGGNHYGFIWAFAHVHAGFYLLTRPRETVRSRPPSPNTPIPFARPAPSTHASSGSMSLLATMK